mgnify:CR=1 FL=1
MLREHFDMDSVSTDRHFSKDERLCGEIRTTKLFANGKGFIVYPLRIVYRLSDLPEKAPVRILVSVPKKKLKRAVERNRIKRLIREAYRLNKHQLIEKGAEKGMHLHVGIVYLDDKCCEFPVVEEKLKTGLNKLIAGLG